MRENNIEKIDSINIDENNNKESIMRKLSKLETALLVLVMISFSTFIYLSNFYPILLFEIIQKCFFNNIFMEVQTVEKIKVYFLRVQIYLPLLLFCYFYFAYIKSILGKLYKENMKIFGYIFFCIGLFLVIKYTYVYNIIFDFATKFFSHDKYIPQIHKNIFFIFFILVIFTFGFISIFNKLQNIIINQFFNDKYKLNQKVYALPTFIGIALCILYYTRSIHFDFLYKEDNFFESLSALLYCIAALFLIYSIKNMDKYEKVIAVIFSFIMIFLFFEEISYGSRIIHIKPLDIFIKYNYQKEINIHNFFNPYFELLYPLFGIIFLTSNIILYISKISKIFELFIPHKSLIPLMIIIFILSISSQKELTEELLPLYLFFYSYRIYVITKHEYLINKINCKLGDYYEK